MGPHYLDHGSKATVVALRGDSTIFPPREVAVLGVVDMTDLRQRCTPLYAK